MFSCRSFSADRCRILDALGAGVVATSAAGAVTHVNRQAVRLLRRPAERLLGLPVATVLAPLTELVAGAASSGERRAELVVRLTSGDFLHLGYSLGRIDDGTSGAPHHVVLFQEIGSLMALRRERDRLLQMAALGDALPAVLHEVKNPLAAVTTMLELMVEEAHGQHQRDLHGVLTEVRRVNLCLEGIGGLVRNARATSVDAIDEAVREAARVLEPTAARRGVRLRAVGATLPPLPLSRAVVSGLVFNIVRNAIDACGPDDDIEVDACVSAGGVFELVVRDSGQGMTADVLARCCDLFFTTKDTGSGLGLALCKQVAQSCGGDLAIDSDPGHGTTVRARLLFDESALTAR